MIHEHTTTRCLVLCVASHLLVHTLLCGRLYFWSQLLVPSLQVEYIDRLHPTCDLLFSEWDVSRHDQDHSTAEALNTIVFFGSATWTPALCR